MGKDKNYRKQCLWHSGITFFLLFGIAEFMLQSKLYMCTPFKESQYEKA